MKKWLALLLVLSLLLLCACANTTVSYRLTDDNRVDVDYRMEITSDAEDVPYYARSIIRYWESMGFTAEKTESDDTVTLTGTKTIESEDMEESVDALTEMLTNEESLFYDVDFEYSPSYFQDDFSLEASISLEDLLRQDSNGELPVDAAESLLEKAGENEYTLTIELPGKVVSTNADSQDGQCCMWNLKYGEVTNIKLATTNVFSDNVEYYSMLQNAQNRDNLLLTMLGATAGLALIASVLALVLRARRLRIQHTQPVMPYQSFPPSDQNIPPNGTGF